MKRLVLSVASIALRSTVAFAGVSKILNNSDGSKAVMCTDGSYGTITFPASSICAGGNGKSHCKTSYSWSISQAASYICN